jgi:hypothetical protein
MARHLLIGDESAVSYTAGVLDFGSIDIQKEAAGTGGMTSLVMGDTVADADRIRIVQGDSSGSGKNIVSPWIYGRDVINWSGKGYSTQVAATATIVPVATSAAASKDIEVKLIRTDGVQPEFFKFNVTIPASTLVAAAGAAIVTAFDALDKAPAWITTCAGTTTVTFTGTLRGATSAAGGADLVWDEAPVSFNVAISDNPTTTQTYTIANNVIDASPGYGDGEWIYDMESNNMGSNSGYYNRVKLPKAPNSNAVKTTNYDVWNIAATKDGSSSSQINGVDNLIDINIAVTTGSGANALSFENRMNAYLGSVGFANVTL